MKILEVSYTDLPGKRFNGYDLIKDLKNHDIKQAVLDKCSKDSSVIDLFNNYQEYYTYLKLYELEQKYSLHGTLSISSQLLLHSKEYKNADKIHIHSLANCNMSLYSLIKISEEKDLVLSFHDPWYLTGRCVHFFECDSWKSGCKKCIYLNTHYPFREDTCNMQWKLKKNIFSKINPEIIYPSIWMERLIKESPITKGSRKKNLIPFGIDVDKFVRRNVDKNKYNISSGQMVLFFRAQKDFKGVEFIVEALKNNKQKENITIITCGQKGLLKSLKKDYQIKEFGFINEETLIELYSITDIFLMPSTGETFGLMAIEAMSCKCPIIVFKNTALENIVNAPKCGIAAEYKNSDSLLKNIIYLINHPDERIKRGENGRKLVVEKYKLSDYLNKINNIYKKEVSEQISCEIMECKQNNLLVFLNEVSDYILNKNPELSNKLKYKCDVDNKKIDFSDLEVQKTIYNYCENLYEIIKNEKIKVPLFIKIKFWLKKHRKIYDFVKSLIRK